MTDKSSTELYLPKGTQPMGTAEDVASIIVYGRSGVGKSHLVYQATHDAEWHNGAPPGFCYKPEEILVWMAEDATTSYGTPAPHIRRISSITDLRISVEEMIGAAAHGHKMPKLAFIDSFSGICDYQMKYYKEQVPFSGKSGLRDKLAEYGDLGSEAIDVLLLVRDQLPFDVVTMVTTFEPGNNQPPELAIPGKLTPKNLTRLTTSAFYMRSFLSEVDPDDIAKLGSKVFRPHRSVGYDPDSGKVDGQIINRFFLTQDNGEVFAKGHHNLALKECAILPDVLRKIHGVTNPKEKK